MVPPDQGETATSAEKASSFIDVKREIAGEIRFVNGWIGEGPKVRRQIVAKTFGA